MTVKDLIKKKDYDYISWRVTLPEKAGGGDTFFGACASVDGKLIPLDGDSYDDEAKVLKYKEWSHPEDGIKSGLTVVIKGEWF